MSVPLVYEGIGNEWIFKDENKEKKKYKIIINLTNYDVKHHLYKLNISYKNIDNTNEKPDEIYIIGKNQEIYENSTGKGLSFFIFSSNKYRMIFKYNINDPDLGILYGKYCLKLNKCA